MAEGESFLLGAQLADAADVVIVQVDAHELLLVHSALGRGTAATRDGRVIPGAARAQLRARGGGGQGRNEGGSVPRKFSL